MKPWQLLILALIALALCVVPWVRADEPHLLSESCLGGYCCSAWDDNPSMSGHIRMECRVGKLPPQPMTNCYAKMEQAMRAMDEFVPEDKYDYMITTEHPIGRSPRNLRDIEKEEHREAIKRLERIDKAIEQWNTVKQECWTEGTE